MSSDQITLGKTIDQEAEAFLDVNFFEPKPKQLSGEVPVYMYWYKTSAADDESKLNAENYEFLDTIGPGFPTVRNGVMKTENIKVRNARNLSADAVPDFFQDGFENTSLGQASALQQPLFDSFDIAKQSRAEVERFTRYALLPNALSQAATVLNSDRSGLNLNVTDAMVFDYNYRFSSKVEGFPTGITTAQAHVDFNQDSATKRLALVRKDPDQNVEYRQKFTLNQSASTAYLKPCENDLVSDALKNTVSFSSLSSDQEFMKNFDPSRQRIIMLNAWVPLSQVIARPLIMCSVKNTDRERDLFKQTMYFEQREGEVCIVRYHPEQSWYYYPHMNFGEMLLLRTWDSAENSVDWWTPHSGAVDPREVPLDIPRKSVEIRMAFACDKA